MAPFVLPCAAWMHAHGQGEHVPFLQACWDDPFNDVPRLVYADWLDDHGNSERASYIRQACAAEAEPFLPTRLNYRESALERPVEAALKKNLRRWLPGIVPRERSLVNWERGLPCGVFLHEPKDWDAVPSLVERLPIFKLGMHVNSWVANRARRAKVAPSLVGLRVLNLAWFETLRTTERLTLLFDHTPHLLRLQTLLTAHANGILTALQNSSAAIRLRELNWSDLTRLDATTSRLLATAPVFAHLERVVFDECEHYENFVFADWLGSSHLAHCQNLNFFETPIPTSSLAALANNPAVRSLRHLRLYEPKPAGLAALVESPHLLALETLDLASARCQPEPLRRLATHPQWQHLRRLGLNSARLSAACCAALAAGPLLGRLRELDLSETGLTAAKLVPLLEHPGAVNWSRLSLGFNRLSAAVGTLLAARPSWNFTHLGLLRTGCGAGPLELLSTGRFPQMRLIDLTSNRMARIRLGKQWPATLRWLDLTDTHLPASAWDALLDVAEAQPQLRIQSTTAEVPDRVQTRLAHSSAQDQIELV